MDAVIFGMCYCDQCCYLFTYSSQGIDIEPVDLRVLTCATCNTGVGSLLSSACIQKPVRVYFKLIIDVSD